MPQELEFESFSVHLKEDLSEDDVILVLEHRREDDGHSIGLGLDVHRLVVTIVNDGRRLALFLSLLEGEVPLEDGGEAVPLQLADLGHDGLFEIGRNVAQVDLDRDVEAFVGIVDEHLAIFAFQKLVGAVVLQLLVELEGHADVDLGLVAVGRVRNAIEDAVKVGQVDQEGLWLVAVEGVANFDTQGVFDNPVLHLEQNHLGRL